MQTRYGIGKRGGRGRIKLLGPLEALWGGWETCSSVPSCCPQVKGEAQGEGEALGAARAHGPHSGRAAHMCLVLQR